MNGDTGVILPQGWEHPAHWPQWDAVEDDKSSTATTDVNEPSENTPVERASSALKTQIRFVLDTISAAQEGAKLASIQVKSAVEKFIEETQLNTSDEIEIFIGVADVFTQLAASLDDARLKGSKIQALEAVIAAQKAELERLTRLLENQPSARSQIMVGAFGGAGAVALTGATAYFFGPEGTEIITNIMNYFASNPVSPVPKSLILG